MLHKFQGFQIAKKIHLSCKALKVSRLLRDQLLRASSSIALNMAEGSGKRTLPDQRRFYSMAFGSLRECEAILELEEVQDKELLKLVDQLGAILYTLTKERAHDLNRTKDPLSTASRTATEAE
jgi:four helix bundle protein